VIADCELLLRRFFRSVSPCLAVILTNGRYGRVSRNSRQIWIHRRMDRNYVARDRNARNAFDEWKQKAHAAHFDDIRIG